MQLPEEIIMRLPKEVINIILSYFFNNDECNLSCCENAFYISQKHPFNILSFENYTYVCPRHDIFLSSLIKKNLFKRFYRRYMEEKSNPINYRKFFIHFSSTSELHIFYSYIDFNRLNCEQTGYCCDKKGMKVKVN